MDQYVSAMGRGRTRDRLRAAGWGLLINPTDPRDPEGFRYMLDNGAWNAFQDHLKGKRAESMLDLDKFETALERYGSGADFVVLPDIVAGGQASLDLSTRWVNRGLATCGLVLIAVQDGMEHADLAPFVGPSVGIFLGGSTEWKLARMADWGEFCALHRCHYHVARVNTVRRYRMAAAAGATSTDGSSATKFPVTLAKLDAARRQPDMFAPRRVDA